MAKPEQLPIAEPGPRTDNGRLVVLWICWVLLAVFLFVAGVCTES